MSRNIPKPKMTVSTSPKIPITETSFHNGGILEIINKEDPIINATIINADTKWVVKRLNV